MEFASFQSIRLSCPENFRKALVLLNNDLRDSRRLIETVDDYGMVGSL